MGGRPDSDQEPVEPPADEPTVRFSDIPITDRWAPLVRDPEQKNSPMPANLVQRTLAAIASLIVLALILWAIA